MFDLNGRTALVTGAGQGMGLGISKALAEAGATVYVNDLFEDRATAAAKSIGASALPGDITAPHIRKGFLDAKLPCHTRTLHVSPARHES